MWIFSRHGFISAVCCQDDSKHMLVRARKSDHLASTFPGCEIECTPHSDYRFRTIITREMFLGRMLSELADITYPRFTDSLADSDYHDAAYEVWEIMHKIQPGANPYKHHMSQYNHY